MKHVNNIMVIYLLHNKMTCYTGEFTGELKPSSEIEKIIWVTSKDISVGSPADKLILNDLKTNGLID